MSVRIEAWNASCRSLEIQLVVVELDRDRRLVAAVDDARDSARVAQAAARTRALRGALGRADFDLHVHSSGCGRTRDQVAG